MPRIAPRLRREPGNSASSPDIADPGVEPEGAENLRYLGKRFAEAGRAFGARPRCGICQVWGVDRMLSHYLRSVRVVPTASAIADCGELQKSAQKIGL